MSIIRKLKIYLYGRVGFDLDEQPVVLPYFSSVKVLLALINRRQIKRDVLCELIWPDKEPEIAKKNLRTALYEIRKNFYPQILTNRGKDLLILDPEIEIQTDLDFALEMDPNQPDVEMLHQLLTMPMLKTISRDDPIYELLLPELERKNKSLVELLYQILQSLILRDGEAEEIHTVFDLLLHHDPFHEQAYKQMLQWHLEHHRPFEASELYAKYKRRLAEDLGIMPDRELEELLHGSSNSVVQIFTKSREDQIERILHRLLLEITSFLNGDPAKSALITALPGTGREQLIDELQSRIQDKLTLIEIDRKNIGQYEESFPKDRLKRVALINGTDWMQCAEAKDMIKDLSRNPNVLFICHSMNLADAESECILSELANRGELLQEHIELSGDDEIKEAIQMISTQEDLHKWVDLTGRRPLLLSYLTGLVTEEELEKFFDSQYLVLDEFDRISLEMLALFEGETLAQDLIELSDELGSARIDRLMALQSAGIIQSYHREGKVFVKLFAKLFQQYIQRRLEGLRELWILDKIANGYEKLYGRSGHHHYQHLNKMIESFKRANNTEKELEYRLQNIIRLSDVFHEFFPILKEQTLEELETRALDPSLFLAEYNDIRKSIAEHKILISPEEELHFEFIYARYLKSKSIKSHIINIFTRLLEGWTQLDDPNRVFDILVQLIQTAINANNYILIESILEQIHKKLLPLLNEEQMAVLLRLSGYSQSVKGRDRMGIELVNRSLSIFESLNNPDRYALSFVAGYFYLGEIYRRMKDYSMALDCYSNTLEYINDDITHPSISILLSRLGIVNYELGNYLESMYYLERSVKEYQTIGFIYGIDETMHYLNLCKQKLHLC